MRPATLLALLLLAAPTAGAADPGPVNVALVLDTSGSLRPADTLARRRIGEQVARSLPAGSSISVFSFDDQPRLVQEHTQDTATVLAALGRLRKAGRYTALHDAVFDASRYLAQLPGEARSAILLITDGRDENSALSLEDAAQAAREAGVPVFTVGLGQMEERVLRRLAKLTGGEHFSGRTDGARIGARMAALAPPAVPVRAALPARGALTPPPATQAAPPTAARAEAPPGAAEGGPRRTLPAGAFDGGRLALLAFAVLLAVGGLGALAFVLLRRPRAAEQGAGDSEVLGGDDDEVSTTLMRRAEPGDEDIQPTLILTLRPLLHITKGPAAGRIFEVSTQKATSIGRAKINDVVLQDLSVSGQHCRIRAAQRGYEIFDLQSTNGTFVNERRIKRQALAAGDVIKVGESLIQFRMDHVRPEGG